MSPATKSLIKRALTNHLGDNLSRARATFASCTPEEMDQRYGQSSQTRREILNGYEKVDAEIAAVIAEVEALP